MKTLFFNAGGHLRNGWWVAVFLALFAASRRIYTPLSRSLQDAGIPEAALDPLPVLFALLVTWACTRLRREPLSSVGLRLDGRWLKDLAAGSLVGLSSMLAIATLIGLAGGVSFSLNPGASWSALLSGLYFFVFVALLEELLFRGFVFQRLVDGIGIWPAQLALALLFAAGHWDNPGMDGITTILASLDIGLGAILYGLAYLRTRSLALPVGMHLGWNLTQGSILGFEVSGLEQTGLFQRTLHGESVWLNGGSFGPESSVFAVLVDVAVLVALWRWKGRQGAAALAPPPAVAALAESA
ncbi:MAG: CPBP family intramembrane metalloprotease [Gammaproteobacteria bacterium]|nr:CPBP family intramembrane metalloprotease [Gammaproteobacteria bacterium]